MRNSSMSSFLKSNKMWKTKTYPITNLYYQLFWKPKRNITYRSREDTRYSHGNAGYLLGTRTQVIFVDRNEERSCTFSINNANKISIKIGKKLKWFNMAEFKFYKSIERSIYWGQGGGDIRTFKYTIVKK